MNESGWMGGGEWKCMDEEDTHLVIRVMSPPPRGVVAVTMGL